MEMILICVLAMMAAGEVPSDAAEVPDDPLDEGILAWEKTFDVGALGAFDLETGNMIDGDLDEENERLCPKGNRKVVDLAEGRHGKVLMLNDTWYITMRRIAGTQLNFKGNFEDGVGDVTTSYYIGWKNGEDLCTSGRGCDQVLYIQYSGKPAHVTYRSDACYSASYTVAKAELGFTGNAGGGNYKDFKKLVEDGIWEPVTGQETVEFAEVLTKQL